MREATPYVKRGSPVSEIGWETPPPESPRLGFSPSFQTPPGAPPGFAPSPPRSLPLQGDRRCIPLKMCYVTRSLTEVDPDKRWGGGTHTHTPTHTESQTLCFIIVMMRSPVGRWPGIYWIFG